jgi:predicted Zn-dependent peptidase
MYKTRRLFTAFKDNA